MDIENFISQIIAKKIKRPGDKIEESTGELKPLPNKEDLQKIINLLTNYYEILKENPEVNYQRSKLEGNEAGLISIAIRLLNIAKYPKGAHFHLDQFSGELDDNSDELIM